MPTFSRGGVRLAYREVGSGFPVVLHTGGAGSSSMWRSGGYMERLAEFRLILLDHRGRGESDGPAEIAAHRVGEYVSDVSALADVLGLTRYGFIGYSFGGAVGVRLAAADQRVGGLVLLGAVFDPPGLAPEPSNYQPAADEASMAMLIELIEQDEALALPDWVRAEFAATDPQQFQLTLEANSRDPDPWDALGAIAAATVLVAGARAPARRRTCRCIPATGAGHRRRAVHVTAGRLEPGRLTPRAARQTRPGPLGRWAFG